MRRRLQIALLVAVWLAGTVFVWRMVTSPQPVDIGLRDAVMSGCETEASIIARFGPPGNYASQPREYEFFRISGQWPPSNRCSQWSDDYAIVVVYFSDSGHYMAWNRANVRPPLSTLQRLERWFDRWF